MSVSYVPLPGHKIRYQIEFNIVPVVAVEAVRSVVEGALEAAGVSSRPATIQAEALIDAELRGVSSHGFLRLPLIVERIANGVADPDAQGCHDWRSPGFLAVDGERGLGPVVVAHALDAITARARTQGVCLAAIRKLQPHRHACPLRRAGRGGGTDHSRLLDQRSAGASLGRLHAAGRRQSGVDRRAHRDRSVRGRCRHQHRLDGPHSRQGQSRRVYPRQLGARFGRQSHHRSEPGEDRRHFALRRSQRLRPRLGLRTVGRGPVGRGARYEGARHAQCDRDLQQGRSVHRYRRLVARAQRLSRYRPIGRPAQGFDHVTIPGERGRASRQPRLQSGLPIDDTIWGRLLELAARLPPKVKEARR